MEGLALTLWPPTAWHWLAVALFLLSIEMMTGTWDLLWVGLAAAVTSAFAAFAPAEFAGWQGQLICFAIATVVLFITGRTLFRSMRENIEEHPTLNKRMVSTLGQSGTVADDFNGGVGQVKLGDTVWSAQSVDGANLASGAAVVGEAAEGTGLKVEPE